MLFSLDTFPMVICSLLGIVLGALAASIRAQQHYFRYKSENQLLHQQCQQWQKENQNKQQQITQLLSDQQAYQQLQAKFAAANERIEQHIIARNELTDKCEKLKQEVRFLHTTNSQQDAEICTLNMRFEQVQLANNEKQQLLINSEQRLTEQFENLANRIFEQTQHRVGEQNQQKLTTLLSPLREQLDGFRKQIQESFSFEAKERHTLTFEIRQLQQLNQKMAQEAINLTNALKQNNKTQGHWGEIILNKVLEASGLREAYEYQTQVNVQNEKGERQQPDVIVNLPQGKQVIIDAKMSLIAYERYFNQSDDHALQKQALSEHITSIRNHIKLLSNKNYQDLPAIKSLDFVLMFIPIEPAFLLAIEHQPELINEALKQNIMLVSPTTLLVALRTINNLWRYENQNQNTRLIAQKAAKLYDKVRLFVDDMVTIGQHLTKAQKSYQQALNKLSNGRGNILSQVEDFRHHGVEVNKEINLSGLENQRKDNTELAEISTKLTHDPSS